MILILFSGNCFTQEKTSSVDNLDIDQQKSRISLKYTKGPYLLYDCLDEHWVCTDKNEAEYCENKRSEGFLEKDQFLICASLKKFETATECHKKQKWLTTYAVNNVFCKNPKFKSASP